MCEARKTESQTVDFTRIDNHLNFTVLTERGEERERERERERRRKRRRKRKIERHCYGLATTLYNQTLSDSSVSQLPHLVAERGTRKKKEKR